MTVARLTRTIVVLAASASLALPAAALAQDGTRSAHDAATTAPANVGATPLDWGWE